MRLTILGSGTNVHPTRAAAGYVVQTDQTMLLDFGPGTLHNLIKTGIDRHRIRHILFSHFHADHFSDFVTFFFDAVYHSKFVGPRADLTLIGPRGTRQLFGTILSTFPGFNTAAFRVRIREVAGRSFMLGKTRVLPRTVVHSPRLHCVGYRLEHGDRALVYSGDAQYCPSLVRLCRGADVAVLGCLFPAPRPGLGHMDAGAGRRVARVAGCKQLILSLDIPIALRHARKREDGRSL